MKKELENMLLEYMGELDYDILKSSPGVDRFLLTEKKRAIETLLEL